MGALLVRYTTISYLRHQWVVRVPIAHMIAVGCLAVPGRFNSPLRCALTAGLRSALFVPTLARGIADRSPIADTLCPNKKIT